MLFNMPFVQGFGEVTVNRKDNGIIVAEFKDASIANEVCYNFADMSSETNERVI